MEVSRGTISPEFSKNVFSYIIYLPYEMLGSEFTVSGTAFDSKSQSVSKGIIDALAEGVNTTTITCTAEDGTTTQTYTVHVIVMPPFTGAIPLIEGVDTIEPESPNEEVDDTEIIESTEVATPQEEPDGADSFGSGWMFFVGLIVGAVGSMAGWYVYRKHLPSN